MQQIAPAIAILALFIAPAQAQLSNMLQGAMGGGQSGGISGLATPSLGAASPANLAGVLQFCVQNNYLGGSTAGSASSVQSGLLSKFTGAATPPAANPGFASGAAGMLNTGNGQNVALGGGGLKAQLTQKLCDQVLKHGQSLL